jgi:hypothetical protein
MAKKNKHELTQILSSSTKNWIKLDTNVHYPLPSFLQSNYDMKMLSDLILTAIHHEDPARQLCSCSPSHSYIRIQPDNSAAVHPSHSSSGSSPTTLQLFTPAIHHQDPARQLCSCSPQPFIRIQPADNSAAVHPAIHHQDPA